MLKINPRISVLMPAYNVEQYVGDAIESILNQTFTDFEFIIINDGSTDKTASIITKYAKRDKRIKFVNHSKNKGLISVLNEGLDLCSGEYIARFDSDDISLSERFEKQVVYMDKHPECGVVSAWPKRFGPNVKQDDIFKYQPEMKLFDFIFHGCCISHPCAMIRRSVLVNNNIKYNPKCKYAEDYDFWIEIVRRAEIHNLQEVLLLYRWSGENISVKHAKEQKENFERTKKEQLSKLFGSEYELECFFNANRELNESFYLFGFLPVLRRKQYATEKTKYYLFDKIPLIKESHGNIYLFEFIKIGVLK